MTETKDLTKEKYFASKSVTTLAEIEALAKHLLDQTWTINIYRNMPARMFNLGLLGWEFEFNTRKRASGLCEWKDKNGMVKKIYISEYLLSQNLECAEEFENTIRHEIAHAIDFEMRGTSDHKSIWQAIAREVLCNAERCFSGEIKTKVETKYTLKCANECGFERASYKAAKKNARSYPLCPTCYHNGNRNVRLIQIQNY